MSQSAGPFPQDALDEVTSLPGNEWDVYFLWIDCELFLNSICYYFSGLVV